MVVQDLIEVTKMLKRCRIQCIQIFKYKSSGCATKFNKVIVKKA